MLREDIRDFIKTIPENICVVAATKYATAEEMATLYQAGIHYFGENRTDSFLEKYEALQSYPIHWHFIGHLQRNKAKDIVNKIECLHSLDSLELAEKINALRTTPLDCFIEVSINLEENKNGVSYKEINPFMESVLKLKNIRIIGFMMMSRQGSSHTEYLQQFKALRYLRDRVSHDFSVSLPYLSMGMSEDYLEALEAGATHIRLGRILWKN